jgi:hypothetical protein
MKFETVKLNELAKVAQSQIEAALDYAEADCGHRMVYVGDWIHITCQVTEALNLEEFYLDLKIENGLLKRIVVTETDEVVWSLGS